MQLFYNFQQVNIDFTSTTADQAMLVRNGRILWMGDHKDLPVSKTKVKPKKINLKNAKVMPSFIECHTHTVFAGSRADEFELRNTGTSYLDIAARGGGILSTVKSTKAISEKELLRITQSRVNHFLHQGVSTLEIKSGYGLDLETELKMLTVARKCKGPRIVTTYLGAHAKPKDYTTHEDYLKYIIKKVLPVLKKKKLARRVDIFVEKNFFSPEVAESYLKEFKKNGFDVVIHANQLSESGGVELAFKLNAKSADHVICLSSENIKQFSQSETVAVLLPAADLYMKCDYPPARKLIDAGVTVALATDFNPGSCPTQDVMLVGLLARLKMDMTLPEVFKAYTIGAAKALALDHEEGTLEVNKYANFICTQGELTDFFYSAGEVPSHDLFIRGNKIKK